MVFWNRQVCKIWEENIGEKDEGKKYSVGYLCIESDNTEYY